MNDGRLGLVARGGEGRGEGLDVDVAVGERSTNWTCQPYAA